MLLLATVILLGLNHLCYGAGASGYCSGFTEARSLSIKPNTRCVYMGLDAAELRSGLRFLRSVGNELIESTARTIY